MTIRTFWTIFIKILGIWLVMGSVTVIPQFLSTLFFATSGDSENIGLTFGLLLLTIGIYLFILRLFVFKSAWLIDKLHLDKGFTEDKIDINIQSTTVLKVAVVVIGGLMFVEGLPDLCRGIFEFYQSKNMFRENPNSGLLIFQFVKTIIGYLLITSNKPVVAFIEKQGKQE